MSMRSQVYEWANLAPVGVSSALRRSTADVPKALTAGREYDIFIGGYWKQHHQASRNNCNPVYRYRGHCLFSHLVGAVQIRINTTDYFQNPDVTDQSGIPGLASPYPRGAPSSRTSPGYRLH